MDQSARNLPRLQFYPNFMWINIKLYDHEHQCEIQGDRASYRATRPDTTRPATAGRVTLNHSQSATRFESEHFSRMD